MGSKGIAAVFLAGAVLFGSPAGTGRDAPGHLARRGGDDGEGGHRGRHRGGRHGVETVPAGVLSDPRAKELFEARCSVCHSLSRPLRKSRERKWWVETVTRMREVNGCPLTDEEALAIIDYLSAVRGPGAPRGPDDDDEHHPERGAPAAREEGGSEPAGPPAAGGDSDARALFESKCSICHELGRPLGKTKDRQGWTATVTRMKQVNGCPITDEEARTIIDYLATVRGPASR